MAGCHHRCNEHELRQTLGDTEGQGRLVCCSPRDRKESDTARRLNNNSKIAGLLKPGVRCCPEHQSGIVIFRYSVTHLCLTLCDPTDCSPSDSSLHRISMARIHWSRLPFPPPGNLPNSGIEPESPVFPALAGWFFTTEHLRIHSYSCSTVNSGF